jgi:hypothetical protein
MGIARAKPNKFNEVFESANRLRTVRNAPNPFLIARDSKTGEYRKSERRDTTVTTEKAQGKS